MKRVLVSLAAVFFSVLMLPNADSTALAEEKPELISQQLQEATSEESKSGLVTIDFEDADIRNVIRVIALASGMNMVIGEDVQAKVTISLKDMPWERALDVILRTYNFTYKKEENLIRIMTFEKIKQEERDIPLTTKVIYLNFAEVGDLKDTLAKMLSDRGSIEVDVRTNSMLITDIPVKVEEVEKIARKLDTRTPQVLIEAMLVDVKLTEANQLGINWQIFDYFAGDANQTGAPTTSAGERDFIQLFSDADNVSNAAAQFSWVQRIGQYRIDGLIKAWMEDKKANILASPKIVTLDNQTATIEIKSQVAYTQATQSDQGGTTTSTQFKDVITGLEVTPHITKEGFISMNVKPRQEFVESLVGASGEPQIGSRSAETNVLVKDGETIVIGGLRKIEDTATITKVPILGDIPILGNFFRKKIEEKINTELVMFVTPHIITHPELTDEEIDRYEMLDDAREKFLKEQEKERKKRLKRRKRQAMLIKPEITEDLALPEEERIALPEEVKITLPEEEIKEDSEIPPSPAAKEEKGYIYSW